jgi:hypothetical protein
MTMFKLAATATFGFVILLAAGILFAGTPQKWSDLPEAVQKTILANGGSQETPVDKEGQQVEGQDLFEAQVRDKDGGTLDLQITANGKLIDVKTDDSTDSAKERMERSKQVLAGVKFSRPREITNPYLPLSSLKQDILAGKEGSDKVRIERTAKPEIRKTYTINNQTVESFCVEDREYVNGALAEVALDYFAQDDNGTVFYLGEDVDEYKDGKVVGHSGTWHYGRDTQSPGILFPAQPKVGDKFMPEDVSKEIHENDEVVSVAETVKTSAGTYANCVKVKEVLADGEIEYKYYAKGIGVVREVPDGGDVLLTSHTGSPAKPAK